MERFYNILTGVVMAAGLTFLASSAFASDNSELKALQDEAIAPVVQLHRNCSGVVVNTSDVKSTYIVTANHCVSDGAAYSEQTGVINIDEKERSSLIETKTYAYDVLARDTKQDLAVIKLRSKDAMLPGANIITEDPVEGEDAWTIGYPLGLTRTVTKGVFGQMEAFTNDMGFDTIGAKPDDPVAGSRTVYRATPALFGGNSGGGMFVKRDGHFLLAGISDAGFRSFFVAGYYNPQDQVRKLLERALANETKTEKVTIEQKKSKD